MNFTNIKYKANYYVLLMLAFIIPLERKLIAPLIILFLITSFFNGEFKFKKKPAVLIFAGLYVLYLIGLFNTENFSAGIADVTTKLSLLIFPVAFFISSLNLKEKLKIIIASFVGGCLIAAILGIINSLLQYYFSLDSSLFFYGELSLYSHPSYYAMLLCLAVISLYYYLFKGDLITSKFKSIVLIFFFSGLIILLASKSGLISMLLVNLCFIVFWIIKFKKYVKGIVVIIGITLLCGLTYNFSSFIKNRIDEVAQTIDNKENIPASSTSAMRMATWESSVYLINKSVLFGYGTGDVKGVLMDEYQRRNLTFVLNKKLNSHNQFLQTMLAIGIVGGIMLLIMILFPLFLSLKHSQYLYLGFLLLIGVNFLTESMLERQLGVVFYSFFNTLFFVAYFGNGSSNKNARLDKMLS